MCHNISTIVKDFVDNRLDVMNVMKDIYCT